MYYDLFDGEIKKSVTQSYVVVLIFAILTLIMGIFAAFLRSSSFSMLTVMFACITVITIFCVGFVERIFGKKVKIENGRIQVFSKSNKFLSSFAIEKSVFYYKEVLLSYGKYETIKRKCLILCENTSIFEKEPVDFSYYRGDPNILFVQNPVLISLITSMW